MTDKWLKIYTQYSQVNDNKNGNDELINLEVWMKMQIQMNPLSFFPESK